MLSDERKETTMFHNRDNLFFGRTKSGGVRILKLRRNPTTYPIADGDKPESPFDRAAFRKEDVILDVTIEANEWASIIASVSAHGEINDGWNRAMRFHNES